MELHLTNAFDEGIVRVAKTIEDFEKAAISGFYPGDYCSDEWNERHEHPQWVFGSNLGALQAWVGDNSGFGPKMDVDLSKYCTISYPNDEGLTLVDVLYFSDSSTTMSNSQAKSRDDKSWLLIDGDHISLWDT